MKSDNFCEICKQERTFIYSCINEQKGTSRRICADCYAEELASRPAGIVRSELIEYYRQKAKE